MDLRIFDISIASFREDTMLRTIEETMASIKEEKAISDRIESSGSEIRGEKYE